MMIKTTILFETIVSFAIFVVSITIVYLAFTLVPVSNVTVQPTTAQPIVGEAHVGRVTGRTDLFTVDRISVDGKVVIPAPAGVRKTFSIAKGSAILASGWALDSAARRPASRIIAVVGTDQTIGPISVARPDVVAAFHLSADSVTSGFDLSVPTADLQPGLHRLHFLVVGADGVSVLDTNASFDFIEK